MPDSPEQMVERDEAFRERMRQRQDEPARKWADLDEKAIDLDQQQGRDERKRDGVASSVSETHQAMTEARTARDDFRGEQPPPGFLSDERKQWQEQYQSLDDKVGERSKDFERALRDASPEHLDAMGTRIDERRDALAKTIEERQAIARLPSEGDQEGQGTQSASDTQASRTAQREEGEGQEGRGQGASARMRPNFSAYATTVEEDRQSRQLEEDQRTVALKLGRTATDAEMQTFERERAERQAQEQGTDQATPSEASPHAEVQSLPKREPSQGQGEEDASEQLPPVAQVNLAALRAGRSQRAEVQGASTVAERKVQAEQAATATKALVASQESEQSDRKRDWGQGSGQGM